MRVPMWARAPCGIFVRFWLHALEVARGGFRVYTLYISCMCHVKRECEATADELAPVVEPAARVKITSKQPPAKKAKVAASSAKKADEEVEQNFRVGCYVELHGLKTRADLNGLVGTVTKPASGPDVKWVVELIPEFDIKTVWEYNLKVVDAARRLL